MIRPSPTTTLRALLATVLAAAAPVRAEPGDLLGYIPFSTVAPQDIARDPADGTFWVTEFLENRIHHYGEDLRSELGVIAAPLEGNVFLTGIAFNSHDSTLFVAEAGRAEIHEIHRDGSPTGRWFPIPFLEVVNDLGTATVRGLDFDPQGDGGAGSIWVVESLGTAIYEVALDGRRLRYFPHPEDPDGFPGEGASARASDVLVIREGGSLTGFWVTGARGDDRRILRLDADGAYTGIAVPLRDAGGNVSGILRQPFPDPGSDRVVDSWLAVVESNARFAALEGGEPEFREIFDLRCAETESTVTVEWTARQPYDRVEILEGCDTLATLGGDVTSHELTITAEGVHELRVRATEGDQVTEAGPCTTVIGPGQVVSSVPVEMGYPIDVAWDGQFLIVSDAFDHLLRFFDAAGSPVGEIPLEPPFVEESEAITGVAAREDAEELYVYNTTRHAIALLNYSGEVLREFEARLPDLDDDPEEEDRGTVLGMALDPSGDDGRGSLWLAEVADDRYWEIDLDGTPLREMPHPYLTRDRGRNPIPYGVYSGGLTLRRGPTGAAEGLLATVGGRREFGQPRIVEIDLATGEPVRGATIPTAAVLREAATSTLALALAPTGGDGADDERLLVLASRGERSRILGVASRPPTVAAPLFLECRQHGRAQEVELTFVADGDYDAVEVTRDCEPVATIPGGVERWIDRDAPEGVHVYSVRGRRGDRTSAATECRLLVGTGALLAREYLWPARSPQQLSRDPVTGDYYVAVDWPGDERRLFRYDAGFRHLETRDTTLEEPWKIAAVALRVDSSGRRLICCLAWQQPVPLGEAGRETFLLVTETLEGEKLAEVVVDPPRPDNGFVTYPTGMVWDRETDTLWFVARNSRKIVQMTTDGEMLRVLPHPEPPLQNFVFNLGLTLDPDASTLLLTGSGPDDHRITRILEVDKLGLPTGRDISLRELPHKITGITVAGSDIVCVGTYGYAEILRLQASDRLPPPFLRGDVSHDGRLAIDDAIALLSWLFRGGDRPACESAADADDNASVNLTDAVALLVHLFLGGPPPPPPFPEPGQDPTPDGLPCEA